MDDEAREEEGENGEKTQRGKNVLDEARQLVPSGFKLSECQEGAGATRNSSLEAFLEKKNKGAYQQ